MVYMNKYIDITYSYCLSVHKRE